LALSAVAYGLLLPVIATLHVLHRPARDSGAILGTIAGASVVALGAAAAANVDLIPAALLVRGVWWWTVGKIWAETAMLSRTLGWATMALALVCFAVVGIYAILGMAPAGPDLPLRMILGVWLIALAPLLWRSRARNMDR
jgi:hypothetical protein